MKPKERIPQSLSTLMINERRCTNEVYKNSKVRKFYNQIYDWALSLPENVIVKKKNEAENLFKKIGITFSVYNNFDSSERLIPFDMFPRIISSIEWKKIKKELFKGL